MHLKIITHERVVFDEDVDSIRTRGLDGEFGILKGHIPIMVALDIGVTRIKQGENSKCFTTMGGVIQFKDDEAIILTPTAECGDEIDVARAKAALEKSRARLAEAEAKKDAKRAEAAIARAMARLQATLKD